MQGEANADPVPLHCGPAGIIRTVTPARSLYLADNDRFAGMPLQLFLAPQLPPLLDHLAETLARTPLPPREDEIIVVQSQGMRRWLTLQLADRFGCAGSLALPVPATFVRDLGQRLAQERSGRDEHDAFSRDALAWRIDALLRALPEHDDAYAPLRTYLKGGDGRGAIDERARFGLATQIAARLDDYQMFRADILHEWESGRDAPDKLAHARWQAALWRTLCAEAGDGAMHLAARMRRTIDALRDGAPANLPARVTVFGVSTLPPVFVDLLVALARHLPVTVYSASLDPHAPHPLAATFGAQSREFIDALIDRGATLTQLTARQSDGNGILVTLQRELAGNDAGDSAIAIEADDTSLRIHDAHGQLRQVEIIRDQLLAALAADPTLRPHDLLLLVPDAAEWAPLVDAVFGVKADDTPRIPYRIADRPVRRTEPAAEALARLLALEGGRFERSEVLGFLSHPLARQAAGLTEGELESLEPLIDRANVRWGYDDTSRAALALPLYEDASWRAGLDRLLLGTAVGRVDDLVLGVLPEAGDTAGDPETLATFAEWVDDLAATLANWRSPRTLADWSATLVGACERFLVASDAGEQQMILGVMATIRRLTAMQEIARHSALVPFAVVRDWLEAQLDDDGFGSGFLQGGMTVAALKPMRSLPFRVIAVAGLDDGVFPRRERRSAFDLLEHDRRAGDRDLRTDDRQLFLDVLLAARERLILAFGGRAVSDNSPRAPSVVIDELLDHLDRRTAGAARRAVVVPHPLQPFSAGYFAQGRDPRLFTYSRAQALAARARALAGDTEAPFVAGELERPGLGVGARFDLTLRDLTDCWTNPSRYFCRRVLRFTLDSDEADVRDDEIFVPNLMQQGLIKSKMLGAELSGTRDAAAEERRFLADGSLPPQALGASWHEKLWAAVKEVLEDVPNHTPAVAVPFTIDGTGWRLEGRVDGIRGNRRYVVRSGSVRAEHRVRAWVEHLAMCAAREQGVAGLPDSTVLIGKKFDDEMGPVANATSRLARLVEAARDAHAAPLPFFVQAGWAWFDARRAKPKSSRRGAPSSPMDPRQAAVAAFNAEASDYSSGGDGLDPYVMLCFRGHDPMEERWDEFEQLCLTLFGAWSMAGGDA